MVPRLLWLACLMGLLLACTLPSLPPLEVESPDLTVCVKGPINAVTIVVMPEGCFSSSCTEILKREGEVQIDPEEATLNVDIRFLVKPNRQRGCTADCEGAGEPLAFGLGRLNPGRYEVWLNGEWRGDVTMPLPGAAQRVCFSPPPVVPPPTLEPRPFATLAPAPPFVPFSTFTPVSYPLPPTPSRTPFSYGPP